MDVNTAVFSGQFSKPALSGSGNIDQAVWNEKVKPEFHPIPIPFRSGLVENGVASFVNVMA
ncbi:MAG: hypothetical protein HPY53_06815 [Brevinematales bacterium]|nr:hypothetical protein [Brevinematales bacterium]